MKEFQFPKHNPHCEVVLASASPRRRDLLREMGVRFTVLISEADESLPEGIRPCEAVELLARRKGEAVSAELAGDSRPILAADTLVALGDRALGKPHDETEAAEMLRALSGRTHEVHTGVAVYCRGRVFSGVATTEVLFRKLSEEEISAYIATGEPMDKAGAYGIQGKGGALVAQIAGEFDNVVGLPCRLADELLCRATEEDI